jgi:hypothetical protein
MLRNKVGSLLLFLNCIHYAYVTDQFLVFLYIHKLVNSLVSGCRAVTHSLMVLLEVVFLCRVSPKNSKHSNILNTNKTN